MKDAHNPLSDNYIDTMVESTAHEDTAFARWETLGPAPTLPPHAIAPTTTTTVDKEKNEVLSTAPGAGAGPPMVPSASNSIASFQQDPSAVWSQAGGLDVRAAFIPDKQQQTAPLSAGTIITPNFTSSATKGTGEGFVAVNDDNNKMGFATSRVDQADTVLARLAGKAKQAAAAAVAAGAATGNGEGDRLRQVCTAVTQCDHLDLGLKMTRDRYTLRSRRRGKKWRSRPTTPARQSPLSPAYLFNFNFFSQTTLPVKIDGGVVGLDKIFPCRETVRRWRLSPLNQSVFRECRGGTGAGWDKEFTAFYGEGKGKASARTNGNCCNA